MDTALREAVARDFPGHAVSRTKVIASTDQGVVVRVFLVSMLKPTPYVIYRVDLARRMASQLHGEEAAPYRIRNYR